MLKHGINEEDEDFELELDELKDLLYELPEDSDDVLKYFQTLDDEIPTEEILTEEQIINFIREEGEENDDDDDDDEIIPPIPAKKATSGLETFINYFEQQDDADFNIDDLCIFKKYLRVARVKAFNSNKQSLLDTFFLVLLVLI